MNQGIVDPAEQGHIPLKVEAKATPLEEAIAVLEILRNCDAPRTPAERSHLRQKRCSIGITFTSRKLANRLRGVHPQAVHTNTKEQRLSSSQDAAVYLGLREIGARSPRGVLLQEKVRPVEELRPPHHVVEDKVDNHSYIELMRLLHELSQIADAAIGCVDSSKGDHIVTPAIQLPAHHASHILLHRHQRDRSNADVAQVRQLCDGCFEGSLTCEAAQVQLVENQLPVAAPLECRRIRWHGRHNAPEGRPSRREDSLVDVGTAHVERPVPSIFLFSSEATCVGINPPISPVHSDYEV
mmetsp:Transcript_40328/g.93495  ORF Transcript_40328/g.93495 Transcript_40328/m.93495 type:complete len:297 (-) Transcript_40328:780-1670(-)